ncbi:MAG: hypothetical protein EOP48_13165 [Sphingobacteriales bacterium]|nr:MAG: hypothetical protein EOP48_13165 [Sphingobacteriales bacterium]
MKGIATLVFLAGLTSCESPRVVTMPYRNYELTAERLMPLSYSDVKQSIRVWISSSTSIDTILTVTQHHDSSYSAFRMELGKKYKQNRNSVPYFSQVKFELKNESRDFFSKIDSLNMFGYQERKEKETVLHEPIALCIVEYLKDKKYTSFSFHWGESNIDTDQENYQAIADFIKREFNLYDKSR